MGNPANYKKKVGTDMSRILVDYDSYYFASPGLSAFKSAMQNIGSAPVRVAAIGSSTTVGSNSGNHLNRYTNKLEKLYQNRFTASKVGGFGILGVNSFNQIWTATGTTATINEGIASRSRQMSASATINRTFAPCTGFTILFAEGDGAQPFTVQVDGGNDVIVTPNSSGVKRYTGIQTVYSGLTRGYHNLKITATNACTINYVSAHDGDETSGFNLATSGVSGAKASDLTDPYMYQAIGTWGADLVIIMIGSNDYASNTNPATYKTNVATMISNVKANTSASIVLAHSYRRLDVGSPTYPWSQYATQLQALANENEGVVFVDISGEGWPESQVADTSNLIDSDNIHQTDAGHEYMSILMAEKIK